MLRTFSTRLTRLRAQGAVSAPCLDPFAAATRFSIAPACRFRSWWFTAPKRDPKSCARACRPQKEAPRGCGSRRDTPAPPEIGPLRCTLKRRTRGWRAMAAWNAGISDGSEPGVLACPMSSASRCRCHAGTSALSLPAGILESMLTLSSAARSSTHWPRARRMRCGR